MMTSEAQRTLVKSPPELWAELSDPDALARHLGELGEIRITRLEPESLIEWESERAAGSVELKASGWGTRVTLRVRHGAGVEDDDRDDRDPSPAPAMADAGDRVHSPWEATPAVEEPADQTAPPGPPVLEVEPELPGWMAGGAPLPVAQEMPAPAGPPSPALEAGEIAAAAEPDPVAGQPFAEEDHWEQAEEVWEDAADPYAEAAAPRRPGFFARLFSWGRRPRRIEDVYAEALDEHALQATGDPGAHPYEEPDSPHVEPASLLAGPPPPAGIAPEPPDEAPASAQIAEGPLPAAPALHEFPDAGPAPAITWPAPNPPAEEPVRVAAADGQAAEAAGPWGSASTPAGERRRDLTAELQAAEDVAEEDVKALLSSVLDRLGAAHHRPFSRP